jgi:integrase
MGLGALDRSSTQATGRSLADVRRRAQEARGLLDRDIDPIEERKSKRSAARRAEAERKVEALREKVTLARVARDYHERVIEPSRTSKHSAQWIASLENNVPEHIWQAPIVNVTAPQLLDAIAKVAQRVPETASRVRQRLEAVFDDAEFRHVREGNPARAVRRKLAEMKKGRRVEGHFAALPFDAVPSVVAQISASAGIAARALEFGVLTAARTAEILGAEWDEFDLEAGLWVVPEERMKAREEHTVFLAPRAVEILEGQRGLSSRYLFPSPVDRDKPLSNMGMLTLLRRLGVADHTTVHGLCRSSFSTWAYENAVARPDVIEAALAHREKDQIKRAYNRAQFNAERRKLLFEWAAFVGGSDSGTKILPFRQRTA